MEGRKGLKITTNGEMEEFKVTGLSSLQKAVGGYIELVGLRDAIGGGYIREGIAMLVNEEGMIYRLPLNVKASHLAYRRIVGNVVIVKCAGEDIIGLTREEIAEVKKVLESIK